MNLRGYLKARINQTLMNGPDSSPRDPTWSRVLRYIYDNQGEIRHSVNSYEGVSADDISLRPENWVVPDEHKIVGGTNLSSDAVLDSLVFLTDFDLLSVYSTDEADYNEKTGERTDPQTLVFQLTSRGFDIAHEREMVRRQDTTNQRVAELTVVLAGAAVIQTLAALFSTDYIQGLVLGIGIVVTLVIAIVIIYSIR